MLAHRATRRRPRPRPPGRRRAAAAITLAAGVLSDRLPSHLVLLGRRERPGRGAGDRRHAPPHRSRDRPRSSRAAASSTGSPTASSSPPRRAHPRRDQPRPRCSRRTRCSASRRSILRLRSRRRSAGSSSPLGSPGVGAPHRRRQLRRRRSAPARRLHVSPPARRRVRRVVPRASYAAVDEFRRQRGSSTTIIFFGIGNFARDGLRPRPRSSRSSTSTVPPTWVVARARSEPGDPRRPCSRCAGIRGRPLARLVSLPPGRSCSIVVIAFLFRCPCCSRLSLVSDGLAIHLALWFTVFQQQVPEAARSRVQLLRCARLVRALPARLGCRQPDRRRGRASNTLIGAPCSRSRANLVVPPADRLGDPAGPALASGHARRNGSTSCSSSAGSPSRARRRRRSCMAGLVPGHTKPGEQVDEDAPLEVERAAAVRLARRAQARERARRVRRRRRRARLPRPRRVDRRLHRRAAPARRRARDRARRRLRPAPPEAPQRPARDRARARRTRARSPSCRSRRSSSRATCRSSRCGSRCRRRSRSRRPAGRRSCSSSRSSRPAAPRRRRASCATPRSSAACCARSPAALVRPGESRRGRRLGPARARRETVSSSSTSSSANSRRAPRRARRAGSTMPSVERRGGRTHGGARTSARRSRACDASRERSRTSSSARRATRRADIAVVLGGDGTMLRALARFLDTGVPVIGVNFGRVGFLTAIPGDELETGSPRVFAGDYRCVELPTLEVELDGASQRRRQRRRRRERDARADGRARLRDRRRGARRPAVRRPDLRDAAGLDRVQPLERRPGARLGARRDGGDLRRAARAPRRGRSSSGAGLDLAITNRTPDVDASCSSTATRSGAAAGSQARRAPRRQPSLLATLPEQTFFHRYGATFGRYVAALPRGRSAARFAATASRRAWAHHRRAVDAARLARAGRVRSRSPGSPARASPSRRWSTARPVATVRSRAVRAFPVARGGARHWPPSGEHSCRGHEAGSADRSWCAR